MTEMDVDDASFRQVVADLTERYGKKIAPHFQPIRENEKLVGYINIIKNAGRIIRFFNSISFIFIGLNNFSNTKISLLFLISFSKNAPSFLLRVLRYL